MSQWLDSSALLLIRKIMAVLSKGFVPANTQKNNAWVMRVFMEWRAQRNGGISDKAQECPENLLDDPDSQKLNFWLSRFVTEVRKQDGQPYPPRTIHQILSALQRKNTPMLENSLIEKRRYSVTSIVHAIVCIENSTLRGLVQMSIAHLYLQRKKKKSCG